MLRIRMPYKYVQPCRAVPCIRQASKTLCSHSLLACPGFNITRQDAGNAAWVQDLTWSSLQMPPRSY